MERIEMRTLVRTYTNNGQHAEQVFRYTLTGKVEKADNISHLVKADCLTYQVKSARATVCMGTDVHKAVAEDAAQMFAYVSADFMSAYLMSKNEWLQFVDKFSYESVDSKTLEPKVRLKSESRYIRHYLEKACKG